MACLICERSAKYELVRDGEAEAEVCEACTEEFLAIDEGDPTCVYCDRPGVYDVRTADGGFPGAETTGDTFATPYESVLCEEHFAELGDEDPAGSPEAADEGDVEDEAAETETDDETTEEAEAEADAERTDDDETDAAAETGDDTGDAEDAEDAKDTGDAEDTEDTGDAEIEAEQDPDGGSDATTKTEGDVTDRDS